ncbi:MAG: HD domain-containing protein, partial [Proteobacteria bacterium]|nr:HD domain-containing protein [Pseudomonadota bacterium]MBU1568940.1 HD domain-containing protein [Pseudomonadota bacterium]
RVLTSRILETLNRPNEIINLIRDILLLLKEHTGIEATGIRLREGDDFPYYVTNGFTDDFVEAENYLCAHDAAGEIIRDSNGNTCLAGRCGNVLCGRTDASLPFFTEGGSFWTNSTTKHLAEKSEDEDQGGTRNRCNSEGYESIALIPLRSGDNIIGLLQLNDSRRDFFSIEMIKYLEGIGASIGIAVAQKLTEEWLLRERSMVDRIMKTSPAGITVVDRKGQIVFANKRAEEIFGLTKNEITQRSYNVSDWHITDFDGNPFPEEQLPFNRVMNTGNPVYGVRHTIEVTGGQRVFLSINGAPILDDSGHVSEVIFTIDDVTQFRQAEQQIEKSIKQLEENMEGTIKAMSLIVETRDPYTAGHQEKVAKLAAAIAEKLKLSEKLIKGILMAGAIHDIGKMYIPAEFLSKPGRLSETEMKFVRTHAQKGYDIMKDIDFPWPVARIILEHHERIDGSGYPDGKSSNDILLESRIIAVADVVEAMASHRPYRPGLGIDNALGEIEKNKGIVYDPDVVDVCLKLFREEGYQLKGA